MAAIQKAKYVDHLNVNLPKTFETEAIYFK